MALEVEATYENGVLRPDHPLALPERQRVRVRIEPSQAESKELESLAIEPTVDGDYGLFRWRGSIADLDYLTSHPDNALWEPS